MSDTVLLKYYPCYLSHDEIQMQLRASKMRIHLQDSPRLTAGINILNIWLNFQNVEVREGSITMILGQSEGNKFKSNWACILQASIALAVVS